jgi:hypothetical protein
MTHCDPRKNQILAIGLALAAAVAGCGPETGLDSPVGGQDLGVSDEALAGSNGLMRNGLMRNGLMRNGLMRNGLNRIGLATTDFSNWFNEDPASSNAVMKYLYACSAAQGTSITWVNPKTGKTYTWSGVLGLATAFAGGAAPTLAEQRTVSACLAAQVNPYGLSVFFSMLGRSATGVPIPYTQTELSTYDVPEACWFGNLFVSEGVGLAFDTGAQGPQQSATRACSFNGPSRQDCAPLVVTGKYCWDMCTRSNDGKSWTTCTWNGVTYPALTTRYRHAEVVTCGDLVCQVSEHCGTGTTADSCKSDCGVCP